MTNFGRGEKKRTCKSQVEEGDAPCAGREGSRIESLRAVEFAAPWEEAEVFLRVNLGPQGSCNKVPEKRSQKGYHIWWYIGPRIAICIVWPRMDGCRLPSVSGRTSEWREQQRPEEAWGNQRAWS